MRVGIENMINLYQSYIVYGNMCTGAAMRCTFLGPPIFGGPDCLSWRYIYIYDIFNMKLLEVIGF